MFIRWKKRKKTVYYWWRTETDTEVFYPIVCKSERVNGKPRQKFLAHLGHIDRASLEHKESLYDFWWRVDLRLSSLDEHTRDKLIEQISRVIPRLSPEEMQEVEDERKRAYREAMAIFRRSG